LLIFPIYCPTLIVNKSFDIQLQCHIFSMNRLIQLTNWTSTQSSYSPHCQGRLSED